MRDVSSTIWITTSSRNYDDLRHALSWEQLQRIGGAIEDPLQQQLDYELKTQVVEHLWEER